MIREFAIDPVLFEDPLTTNMILCKLFSLNSRAVIAEFPKGWKSLAAENLKKYTKGDHITKTATFANVFLTNLIERVLIDFKFLDRKFDNKRSWLANAYLSNKTNPFHAIISKYNYLNINMSNFFSVDNDNLLEDELLSDNPTKEIEKTEKGIAEALKNFITFSSEIVFFDRYFCAKEEYLNTIKEIFKTTNCIDKKIKYCTFLHDDDKAHIELMENELTSKLSNLLPSKTSIEIIIFGKKLNSISPPNDIHNRYVLSNLRGINFPYGLDSKKKSKDIINILGEAQRASLFKKYYNLYVSDLRILSRFLCSGK